MKPFINLGLFGQSDEMFCPLNVGQYFVETCLECMRVLATLVCAVFACCTIAQTTFSKWDDILPSLIIY